MTTTAEVVAVGVRQLSGPDRENAYHRLLDLGEAALPFLAKALELEANTSVRSTLVEIVWHTRSANALPLLAHCLQDSDPYVWKAALDGLVTLGGSSALGVLEGSKQGSNSEKLECIQEALDQVREQMTDGSA